MAERLSYHPVYDQYYQQRQAVEPSLLDGWPERPGAQSNRNINSAFQSIPYCTSSDFITHDYRNNSRPLRVLSFSRQTPGRHWWKVHDSAGTGTGKKGPSLDKVVVATDDDRIAEAVRQLGHEAVMTRIDHPSGTDRCWEAYDRLVADGLLRIKRRITSSIFRAMNLLLTRPRLMSWLPFWMEP